MSNIETCVFKERFKYDPCRACDGRNSHCQNYLGKLPERKKYFQYSTATRFIQQIRRASDEGVI